MIYVGLAFPGWPGSELHRTWQTKSSTTRLARSRELQLSTSATSFSWSAGRLWTNGEPMLDKFSRKNLKIAELI